MYCFIILNILIGLNNENLLLTIYKSCNQKNKSYLVFEYSDRKCLQSRNNDTIPFDFCFI